MNIIPPSLVIFCTVPNIVRKGEMDKHAKYMRG